MPATFNPISQSLDVLGGSANPSVFSSKNKGSNAANSVFRQFIMAQFSGEMPTIGNDPSKLQSEAKGTTNLWQLMSQGANGKNALVIQLSQSGLPTETIDQLMATFSENDLITILKDPALSAALMGTPSANDGIKMPKLADILHALNIDVREGNDALTVNVANMNADEFKAWKKQNFSDLAAFFQQPINKARGNGEIIQILQGPSFLHDGNETSFMDGLAAIGLIPPAQPLTPMQLALQMAGTQAQQGATNTVPNSFVPIPFGNLSGLTPDMKAALMSAKNADGATEIPANGVPTTGKGQNFAQAIAAISQSGAQNNGTTTSSQTLSPAELNALTVGGDPLLNLDDLNDARPLLTGFKTAAHSANPLLAQPSASQPHPTSQMVAISLTRMASGKGTEADTQKYRLQLDPPEMGRVDIDLEFEAGQKVRAVIHVEKPETLSLLQRDAHALLKALQDAGFESVGQDNLNFNLSQGQNDTAGQGNNNSSDRQNGQNALLSPDGSSELDVLDTTMSLVIDPITGQQRVNMVV